MDNILLSTTKLVSRLSSKPLKSQRIIKFCPKLLKLGLKRSLMVFFTFLKKQYTCLWFLKKMLGTKISRALYKH